MYVTFTAVDPIYNDKNFNVTSTILKCSRRKTDIGLRSDVGCWVFSVVCFTIIVTIKVQIMAASNHITLVRRSQVKIV